MSAIALPIVAPSAAVVSGNPVNIETGVVSFYKRDLNVLSGGNPPQPISHGGTPKYEIVFKVNIDSRTGNTDEVVWNFGNDNTARDAEYTALLAAVATTLVP